MGKRKTSTGFREEAVEYLIPDGKAGTERGVFFLKFFSGES